MGVKHENRVHVLSHKHLHTYTPTQLHTHTHTQTVTGKWCGLQKQEHGLQLQHTYTLAHIHTYTLTHTHRHLLASDMGLKHKSTGNRRNRQMTLSMDSPTPPVARGGKGGGGLYVADGRGGRVEVRQRDETCHLSSY